MEKKKTTRVASTINRIVRLTANITKSRKIIGKWHLIGTEGDGNVASHAINAGLVAIDGAMEKLQEAIQQLGDAEAAGYNPQDAKRDAKRLGRIGKGVPKAAGRPVTVGETCTMREKARAQYDGLVSPEDFAHLKVIEIRGKHASVTSPSGARLVLSVSALSVNV